MYFNAISLLAHLHFGDPLLPLAASDPDLDGYVPKLASALGWLSINSTEEERALSTESQQFVIDAARELNRKLHCICSWGQARGERFDPINTGRPAAAARTRDVRYILKIPDMTHATLAAQEGIGTRSLRDALGVVQMYFDTTLIQYHHVQGYAGWWMKSGFVQNSIVWEMLEEIYEKGEEVKRRAKEVRREVRREMESNGREMERASSEGEREVGI